MSRFKDMLANLFTSGKAAWGKTASGGSAQLLFLSVSIKLDLKLLCLVYSAVKITAAVLSLFWKHLQKKKEKKKGSWTTFMLIVTSNML